MRAEGEESDVLSEGFLDELASAAPTPGGGGASACAGALAAALAAMVGNITANSKKYAGVHDAMRASVERLDGLRARLLHLAELDAQAFAPLSAAFKMPADTADQIAAKDLALQSALVQACDVPLDMMRECASVLEECRWMAREGSRMALSDVGVAAALAKAAIQGAALNIYINGGWMTDQALAVRYTSQAHQIVRDAGELADELYEFVAQTVSGGQ